jgi:SAM-dependent methyltransferase
MRSRRPQAPDRFSAEWWDEVSRSGPVAAALDPNDRIGRKNRYLDTLQRLALEPYLAIDGLSVLDFACGSGRWLPFIAARAAKVVGLDLSPGMLELARARPLPSNCELVAYDGETIPFGPDTFDAILAISCLHFLFDDLDFDRITCQLARSLKTGGRVYLYQQVGPVPNSRHREVHEYLSAFENAGARCIRSVPVRNGRSLLLYAIQFGLVPPSFFPALAKREMRRVASTEQTSWDRYRDYVFVFER